MTFVSTIARAEILEIAVFDGFMKKYTATAITKVAKAMKIKSFTHSPTE